MNRLFGGIDAGGTTFKCGLQSETGDWVAKHRVAVTRPAETLAECLRFFDHNLSTADLAGFGIASFGPLDVDPRSPGYGTILKTPKQGWAGLNLRKVFDAELNTRTVVDTDVNGALLAEMTDGVAAGTQSAAYITVGTGIGAGIAVSGHVLGRPFHPEFGHIPVRRHKVDADFRGVCPSHSDCLEGMASVPALRKRWGDPIDWEPDHIGWEIAAHYLAQGCLSLVLTLRVERIVLGGGLMLSPYILPRIHSAFEAQMNGYLGAQSPCPEVLIQTPKHGDDAGLCGAVLLGKKDSRLKTLCQCDRPEDKTV